MKKISLLLCLCCLLLAGRTAFAHPPRYYRGPGPGAVLGGAVLGGLIGGAIVGSTRPYYAAPPPPAYYPPPRYYYPPPGYYYPPGYYVYPAPPPRYGW